MANDSTAFFNWYRRYKVRAVDMNAFEEAMVEVGRGLSEGLLSAAVLRGFEVTPASGLLLDVSAGIAAAASGYLHVKNTVSTADVTPASGSLPSRSLVVCTPDLTDANFITSPTSPFVQVPLNTLQKSRIIVIPGTPAQNPEYPAAGANDVILCGVKLPANPSSIDISMLDFEVRDSIGSNSEIGQNQVRFDDRLRPYRASAKVMGLKPSQSIGSNVLGFSYPGRLTPSLYPLTAGSFTPADSFIDFSTGMITGGDASTPSFTPVIPSGSASVVCAVTLTLQDTLHINFSGATQGGFLQCLNAIRNQIFSGPGCLPALDGNFPLAWVVVSAVGGVISDVQVYDGRPFLGSGAAAAKYKKETPSGVINGSNTIFTLSKVPADPDSLLFFVDSNLLTDGDYTLNGSTVNITNSDLVPVVGQTVYASYLIFGAVSNNPSGGVQTGVFAKEVPSGTVDGSNAVFNLSNTPSDPNSLIFWVDGNPLEATDYSLVGSTVTITNADFIPQLGQSVYSYYLISGSVGGGGGGGGGGNYVVYGNQSSGLTVAQAVGVVPSADQRQLRFVKSAGGNYQLTSTPQISAGMTIGQEQLLFGTSNTDYITLIDGNGLALNGNMDLTKKASILLIWDGAVWAEQSRR